MTFPERDRQMYPDRVRPSRPSDEPQAIPAFEGFAQIKVIGVGGGGSNAIDRMIQDDMHGVDFITVNTDNQALMRSSAPSRIRIGDRITRGLGAGGDPRMGARAAEESEELLAAELRGADMVFIAAGMGGGTGTGAAPKIAAIARGLGALTVAVVTRPFGFEGRRRAQAADDGIAALRDHVDTLITIPNDRLNVLSDARVSIHDAFKMADSVLRQGIAGISDLITIPGTINVDFADVKSIMQNAGSALMAIGIGNGESRARDAARQAIESPLLDVQMNGAKGILWSITGGDDLTLFEVHEAAEIIAGAADPDANIIFGTATDPRMQSQVKVTVIATGFDSRPSLSAGANRSASPRTQRGIIGGSPTVRPRFDDEDPPLARTVTPIRDMQSPPSRPAVPPDRVPTDPIDIPPFLRNRR